MANLTTISSLVSLITDMIDSDDGFKESLKRIRTANKATKASLAAQARANTCQFPVLYSSNISNDTYENLSQILETLFSSYITIAINGRCEVVDLSKENKSEIVTRIHHNNNLNDDKEFGNLIDNFLENTNFINIISGMKLTDRNISKDTFKLVNEELLTPYTENFNMKLLSKNNNEFDEINFYNEAKYDGFNNTNSDIAQEYVDLIKRLTEIDAEMKMLETQISTIELNSSNRVISDSEIDEHNDCVSKLLTLRNALGKKRFILKDLNPKYNLSEIVGNVDRLDIIKQKLKANGYPLNTFNGNYKDFIDNQEEYLDMLEPLDALVNRKPNLKELDSLHRRIAELESESSLLMVRKDGLEKILIDISNTDTLNEFERKKAKEALAVNYQKGDFDTNLSSWDEFNYKYSNRRISGVNRIKKQNALEPTVVSLTIQYEGKNGGFSSSTLSVGVKAVTHLLDSSELIYYTADTLIKKRLAFRFLQFTTGEIKLVRDLILDLDNVKEQAIKSTKTSKWFKHLKDTKINAKALQLLDSNKNSGWIPNVTLVYSKSDVDFLKYKHNLDLFNEKTAKKLCDQLFLLHLIIVDESQDRIMLFHPSDGVYEGFTLEKLNKSLDYMKKFVTKDGSIVHGNVY